MAATADRPSENGDDFLVNALVGAVVSVVLSFLVFSPLVGGAVAGYLQSGDDRTGLKVGAVSGAIASVPVLLVLVLLFGLLSIVTIVPEGVGMALPFAVGIFLLFGAGFVVLFVVALSAVGGLVGAAVARERGRPATAAAPVRATGEAERESEAVADADRGEAVDASDDAGEESAAGTPADDAGTG